MGRTILKYKYMQNCELTVSSTGIRHDGTIIIPIKPLCIFPLHCWILVILFIAASDFSYSYIESYRAVFSYFTVWVALHCFQLCPDEENNILKATSIIQLLGQASIHTIIH